MTGSKNCDSPVSARQRVVDTAEEVKEEKKDEDTKEGETEKQGDEKGDGLTVKGTVPIDRGWAWVVLAGGMLTLLMLGGVRKNLGIFFVAFQDQFGSSASTTSVIVTIQSVVNSVASLLIMTLGMQAMTTRTSIMLGGALYAVSLNISAVAKDIKVLFASEGILSGIAMALSYAPTIATVGAYFDKRRGLANSLVMCGASCGGIGLAPLLTYLFGEYGFRGTITIAAGILLHVTVFGSLMRPTSFWEKAKKTKTGALDLPETKSLLKGDENGPQQGDKPNSDTQSSNGRFTHETNGQSEHIGGKMVSVNRPAQLHNTRDDKVYGNMLNGSSFRKLHRGISEEYDAPNVSPLIQRKRVWSVGNREGGRQRTTSQSSSHLFHNILDSVSHSDVAMYASSSELAGPVLAGSATSLQHVQKPETATSDVSKKTSCCSSVLAGIVNVLRVVFDTSLLSNPACLCFLLMAFIVQPSNRLVFTILPPHSKDLGLSGSQTGVIMAVVSSVDLGARVLTGIIVDRKWVKKTTIIAISAIIMGTASHLIRFFSSFEALVVFAVLAGIFCGAYMSLYATILVDLLTLTKLKSALGFTLLCHGSSVSIIFPVAGRLRDSSGDYLASYHLLGGLLYAGAALALLLPYIHQWRQKRMNSDQTDDKTIA